MAIPSRNNRQNFEKKVTPFNTFYTPHGEDGNIKVFNKLTEQSTEVDKLENMITVAVSFFLYGVNRDKTVSWKSTEYFYKNETVAIWETHKGQKKGKKIAENSVDSDEISNKESGIKKRLNLSTGCYIYVKNIENGELERIQLTAGQRGEFFDFKTQIGEEYPVFNITMRKMSKADKDRIKERNGGATVSFSDNIIVFHDAGVVVDEIFAKDAEENLNLYFGSGSASEEPEQPSTKAGYPDNWEQMTPEDQSEWLAANKDDLPF